MVSYSPIRTGQPIVDRNLDSLKSVLDKQESDIQEALTSVSSRASGSTTTVDPTTPLLTFPTIDWNFSTSMTKAGRFTAPEDGKYRVAATIRTSSTAWAANDVVELYIFKNGVMYSIIDRRNQAAATLTVMVTGSDEVQLRKDEYVDIRCFSQVSTPLAGIGNYMTVDRIGTYA